ncbi:hypothetical protein NIES4075_63330 [Tolypothrix sp. NIES-4075]|uniref:hypothetical protein n=1 Tax=Tolypothrix sp. NIES-4075 TaxID=2005459 RepID=UPI000B5D04B0|nr:hypothetical protein [Tolypothrix sp. NIES-4075]GAX45312.1 hypothetical protein NIES4075_63330 [Tolypothrix sp. NIES-4075]
MSNVWVNEEPLSTDELIERLEELTTSPSYYFLRWAHRVGGFWQRRSDKFANLGDDIRDRLNNYPINGVAPKHPEPFPSPQGQLFNSVLEVRWQIKQGKYQVLLLGSQEIVPGFKAIERDWEIIEQNVLIHPQDETRFPKGLESDVVNNIAQRYFRDKNTATVHFVALTLKNSHD